MEKSILKKSIEMLIINQVLRYEEKEIAAFVKFIYETCPSYKNTDIVIDDIVFDVVYELFDEKILTDPSFEGEYKRIISKLSNVKAELFSSIAYTKILYSDESNVVKDIEIDKLKKFMEKFNISKDEIHIVAKELFGIMREKNNSLT